MTTVFTHPAIALGLIPWIPKIQNTKTVLVAGIVLTVLPDIDVVGFKFGIPYDHIFGHRGFTHSIVFAVLVSLLSAWLISGPSRADKIFSRTYLFLCLASHGLLDAFTNGGLGIAFFSPFSNQRFFFPGNIIEVSTLSIERFFQGQGLIVLESELAYVWVPCTIIFVLGYCFKKALTKKSSGPAKAGSLI